MPGVAGLFATSAPASDLGEGGLGCALGMSVSDDAATLGSPEAGSPDNSGGVDSASGKELFRDQSSKDSEAGITVCASGQVTTETCDEEGMPESVPSTTVSASGRLLSARFACAGVILQSGQGSVSLVSGGSAVVFWLM